MDHKTVQHMVKSKIFSERAFKFEAFFLFAVQTVEYIFVMK